MGIARKMWLAFWCLVALVFAAAPTVKPQWQHTGSSGYWRMASTANGEFTALGGQYPSVVDFVSPTGELLESIRMNAWLGSAPSPLAPLASSVFAMSFNYPDAYFAEYHLAQNRTGVEKGWEVKLGNGYPALDGPIAVAANSPIVAALITDDRVQDNRTGCLHMFTAQPGGAPKHLKKCIGGLLFEDAQEVHLSEDGRVVALGLGFLMQVYDFDPARQSLTLRWETSTENDVQRLALSPDGKFIARRHLQQTLLMTAWNETSKDYEWLWIADRVVPYSMPEVMVWAPTVPNTLAVCWNPRSDTPYWDSYVELYKPENSAAIWKEKKKASEGLLQDVCGGLAISADQRVVAVGTWGKDDGDSPARVRLFQGVGGDGAAAALATTGSVFDVSLTSPKPDAPLPRTYRVVTGGMQHAMQVDLHGGLAVAADIVM